MNTYELKRILPAYRPPILPLVVAVVMALTLLSFDAAPVRAAAVTASITVGKSAGPLALNPATNKIYVIDRNSNQVIVIDGTTNATTKINVGTAPVALAVNQNTNKIYVANASSNDVTVIDGLSCETTTVKVGEHPRSIAVNPVTNKIYVVNLASDDVTVIDALTNVAVTVKVGYHPQSVAVNPITDKIYVANYLSDITVIDGTSNKTVTVKILPFPRNIAINTASNKIYVVGATYATIIDGLTNSTTTIQPGLETMSAAVAVNPTTNMIYISSDFGHGKVIAINGATNNTAAISVGSFPCRLALDQSANLLYVVNNVSSNVSIINCNTGATITISTDKDPGAAVVNPVTQKLYVAHDSSGTVTVIDESSPTASPFINTASLPFGTEGAAYNQVAMKASGGTAPYSWAASGLPDGLGINPSSGEIQGLPTSSGRFTVHITLTDIMSKSAAQDLILIINPATGRPPANIILQIGRQTMQVNGISQDIDPGYDTAPVIVNGRTFVPIGAIIDELGGSVSWSPSEQSVSVYLNGETIGLKIGELNVSINGTPRSLSAAPFISSTGRTMVPLSFIIENLGFKVDWDATTQYITIT